MASLTEWKVPPVNQPRGSDYGFDLDRALASVVGLHSIIPSDAFSAETLGTERAGNGVLIDDGLVLTIGYLITEAETVWLHLGDGRVVQGHALGFDFETGFGLVQALGRIDLAAAAARFLRRPQDRRPRRGRRRRRTHALGREPDRRQAGVRRLLGVSAGRGDLHLSRASQLGRHRTDLEPRRTDRHRLAAARARARGQGRACQHDRADRPAEAGARRPPEIRPRQQAGAALARHVSRTEIDNRVVVVGIAGKGPAARAELKAGDVILAVNGEKVSSQTGFYRKLWALGAAGVDVPLTVYHEGVTFDVVLTSIDRAKMLKAPRLH